MSDKVELTQKTMFDGPSCPKCHHGILFIVQNNTYVCDECGQTSTKEDFNE